DEQFEKALMEKYNTDYIHPPSYTYLYNGKLFSNFDTLTRCIGVKLTESGFKLASKNANDVFDFIGSLNDSIHNYQK
ncbi:MAG: hypothetical protein RR107_00650, partial [Clostridia bacterium]